MKVRPPAFGSNFSTLALNLLIVVSMLLALAGPGLAAPSPAPTAQSGITLSLDKTVTPTTASPGQVVTFTLTAGNTGSQTAHDLVLRDPLPQGFKYVRGSAPEAEYDAPTKALTWNLEALEPGQLAVFSFEARVTGPSGRDVENVASLAAGGEPPLQAPATVAVGQHPNPGQWHIAPGEGGEVILCDGRVTLAFETGTVEHPVDVVCWPLDPVTLPPDRQIFARFGLSALETEPPHELLDDFSQPVTLTITYDAAEIEGLLEDTVELLFWDEEQALWITVPAQLDEEANTLTAQTSQLGVYGLQADDDTYFPSRIEAGQVSLFTGDSSFTYELETPVGAGGLNLPLTLRYNGGVVNGMYGPDNTDGGWVGVGWTLDPGSVEGETLTLDGISEPLVTVTETVQGDFDWGDWQAREWWVDLRTQAESFMRVEQSTLSWTHPTGCTEPAYVWNDGYYEVWGKDGTRYEFGKTDRDAGPPAGDWQWPAGPKEEGTSSRVLNIAELENEQSIRYTYAGFYLDGVEDVYGNRLEVDYASYGSSRRQDGCNHIFPGWSWKESYPRQIRYTTNDAQGDDHAEYRVIFEIEPKEFDVHGSKFVARTAYYLAGVRVEAHPIGASPVTLREYRFEYDVVDTGEYKEYRLRAIQEFGLDGESLPRTEFNYVTGPIAYAGLEYDRTFLSHADNGYGGTVDFDYEAWCYPASPCGGTVGDYMKQVVDSRTVDPGVGAASNHSHVYSQGAVERSENEPYFHRLVGFGQVEETEQNTTRREVTLFDNTLDDGEDETDGDMEDPFRGVTLQFREEDLSGTVHRRTTNEYVDSREEDWPELVHFVHVSETTEDTRLGEDWQTKRVEYEYEPIRQREGGLGGQPGQYGNLTRITEYAGSGALYRTTYRFFGINSQAYIVDRLGIESIYDAGGELVGWTWHYYDGQGYGDAPVDKGELRRQRGVSGEVEESPDEWLTSDVGYLYDGRGNLVRETAYGQPGSAVFDGNDMVSDSPATGDPRETHIDYDTGHDLFPVRVTNELEHESQTLYYGVNGPGLEEVGAFFGQPSRAIDPNLVETDYYYDAFGRTDRVVEFGDSYQTPTQRFEYLAGEDKDWGNGPRFEVETHQRVGEGQPNLWTRELYDGLGRLVQSQRPAEDWEHVGGGVTEGHDIIQWTAYDAAGQVAAESLPYEVEAYDSGGGQSPWVPPAGETSTGYEYDALNRIRTITYPDTTTVNHYYGGWTESVYDQKGHAVSYDQDAFGRLIQVREWGESDTELYATTSYEYDAADNLVAVYDANSHDADGNLLPSPPYVTRMEYDLLGRKVETADPDMGVWKYGYDAVSNLTRQDDAESQRLCLYYDGLDRLLGKYYTTVSGTTPCPEGEPTYDVSYVYDDRSAGVNGVGRRTSMAGGWGSTNWAYDERGRVKREQRLTAGGADLVTQWTYDSADRVVTTTYPNPSTEEVTVTYNPQGLPETLLGVETYVSSAEYNALDQPELIDFGPAGGGRMVYTYHPPDVSNNRLQRIQLLGTSTTFDLSYTYDEAGNVATINDAVDGGAVQRFEYDFLDRITEARDPYTAQTWSYDATGNITEFNGRNFVYTGGGHAHPQPHAVKRVNDDPYEYDRNGNMLNGGDRVFEWDEENRLISGSFRDNDEVTYIYDGDGDLVRKDVGGETTVYAGPHYDYNQDADVHMRYYFFGELRVAMHRNATPFFLHTDHLGSTSLATDGSGNPVPDSQIRYFPYGGSRMGNDNLMPTDYLFTGQRREQNLGGLFHMGARFYHPGLGRWISADPLVPDVEDPQSLNRFAYALNNPLKYRDPSGHFVVATAGAFLAFKGVKAAAGGLITGGTYLWNARRTGTFNWKDFALTAGTGAAATTMIGKAYLLKGAAAKAVKGFGTRALFRSEMHLVGNLVRGEEFDQHSYIADTVFAGAKTGVNRGMTGVAKAVAWGVIAAAEYHVTARLDEQPLERGEAAKHGIGTFTLEFLKEEVPQIVTWLQEHDLVQWFPDLFENLRMGD